MSSSSAVISLKLTSEQFRDLRKELEDHLEELQDRHSELDTSDPMWQPVAQRIMSIEQLLRAVL
jgi:exonuclease VII small subunit